MITRALGAATGLELDEVHVQVSDGDIFLLCSDGLSNAVGPDAMFGALPAAIARRRPTPSSRWPWPGAGATIFRWWWCGRMTWSRIRRC
jgi:hypothetical protein